MGAKDVKNPNLAKEWDTARAILLKYDDHLLNLRKYGFTFVTALLAAESLLLPYAETLNTYIDEATLFMDPVNLPDAIKFAVLFANLLLIIAVVVIDRNFIVIQKAAASRARVIERTLNLELTEVITHRYRSANVEWWVTGLYSFFVAIVVILGFFVFSANLLFFLVLLLSGAIAVIAIIVIRYFIKVEYKYGPIDFTLDRVECTKGDKVAITITNLEKEDIIIQQNDCILQFKEEEGDVLNTINHLGKEIVIGEKGSYTILFDTKELGKELAKGKKFEEGIVRIYRACVTKEAYKDKKDKKFRNIISCSELEGSELEGKLAPLNRKLRVYKKPKETTSTPADLLKVFLDSLKKK